MCRGSHMSIIHDALKKVQMNLSHTGISNKNPSTSLSLPPIQNIQQQLPTVKNDNLLWGITILIGLAVVGCATLVIFITTVNKQSKISSVKPGATTNTNVREIVSMITPTPAPATNQYQPDVLILNGIISTDDEQLALINNQILKAGDYIDGKRVLSISSDKVELFDKGEVLILTTKH